MGIEPTDPAWKAGVLPLNYTRIKCMKLNTAEQKPLFLFECPVPESNQRHEDFQSSALPTELTGRLTTKFILKEKGFAVKQKMQIFLIFFIIWIFAIIRKTYTSHFMEIVYHIISIAYKNKSNANPMNLVWNRMGETWRLQKDFVRF